MGLEQTMADGALGQVTETDVAADMNAAVDEALRLVKFAKFDEAAGRLDEIEFEFGADARTAFARGLIAQRTGDVSSAIAHYRMAADRDPMLHAAAENAGMLMRAVLNPVRPASDRPIGEHQPFIYAIGSSYTRSFGVGSRFLPLMAGVGDNLTFLTDELARRSADHIMAHLARCDRRNAVMLTLANVDAIGHVNDTVGTRDLQARGVLGSDEEIIVMAAHRQADLAERALASFPDMKLMVLNAFPMVKQAQAPLIRLTNEVLSSRAAAAGIPFIDVHDRFADPQTGLLREDFRSAPDDPHFGKHVVPVIEEEIERLGMLPAGDAGFEWSHMMRFRFGDLDETRLWTEPHMGADNLRQSRLNHFNYVLERATNHFMAALPFDGSLSVLIANAREGYVPLALPGELASEITACEADGSRRLMLHRLAHFCGRTDIQIVAADPARALLGQAMPHDVVFAVDHEDDALPPLPQRLSEWADLALEKLFVLSNRDWSALNPGELMFSGGRVIDLSERFLDGYWRQANLLVLER
jgi:hypothetical protein